MTEVDLVGKYRGEMDGDVVEEWGSGAQGGVVKLRTTRGESENGRQDDEIW